MLLKSNDFTVVRLLRHRLSSPTEIPHPWPSCKMDFESCDLPLPRTTDPFVLFNFGQLRRHSRRKDLDRRLDNPRANFVVYNVRVFGVDRKVNVRRLAEDQKSLVEPGHAAVSEHDIAL